MKRTIEVTVSPAGDIQIDAVGFRGADCEKATAFLEQALGIVGNRVKKPEYHARANTQTKQQLGT